MTPAELRESLHKGHKVFGTLIVSPSPRWPEVVATCGLDFVFIDTEHVALDRAQLSWMCQTYNGARHSAAGANSFSRSAYRYDGA